jgi:hypothetical protein
MTIRSKTARNEIEMTQFANENGIPLPNLDYTVNSSGMLTVFYADAGAEPSAPSFGTDDSTGATAGEATAGDAITNGDYTPAINTANATKISVYLTVVTGAATALRIGVRASNLAAPDEATATDWYTALTDDDTSTAGVHTHSVVEHEVPSALMSVTGAKYCLDIDVQSSWTSLVFYGGGAYEITAVVETL